MILKRHISLAVMGLTLALGAVSTHANAEVVSPRGYEYPANPNLPKTFNGTLRDVSSTVHPEDRAYTVRWDSLPFKNAIVRVRGNGEKKMAFFVDPTCPYSRKMEDNLEGMDNVTVYTFVSSILVGSEKIVEAIQCQGDNASRALAYENYSKYKKLPQANTSCANHHGKQINKAIAGYKDVYTNTPTSVYPNNFLFTGLLTLDEINVEMGREYAGD